MCVASTCSYLLPIVVCAMNSHSQLLHRYMTSYHHKGLQVFYARTDIFVTFVATIHSCLFLNIFVNYLKYHSAHSVIHFSLTVIVDIKTLSIFRRFSTAFEDNLRKFMSYAVKFIMTNYIQFESFLIIPKGSALTSTFTRYVGNSTKAMKLNNLSQEVLNFIKIWFIIY